MLLQITFQDKATQTDLDQENTLEKIFNAMTLLCTKVDGLDKEIQKMKSQQHDGKHAELSQSEDLKTPELEGDDGKHRKTQTNNLLHAATGSTSSTKEEKRYVNTNMNKIFEKLFVSRNQNPLFVPPQVNTYKDSLGQDKKIYNHITRAYIENIHKIQTFLNKSPRSKTTQNPHEDYNTQTLQGYNKLIALPKTNANLVATCYNYGLLNTVYTQTGDEIATIPELHKAFMHYKRITKGTLFYIRFYSVPAEILYDEIKPIIQVIKIGLTREMIIPEKIEEQDEIQKVEIPAFYAGKRIIGIATILNELTSNYLNENSIWSYYSREQTMIYSNCREIRAVDMEELRQWALSLLKPEQQPTTRAIRKNFISSEIMTRYCKTIGHKYPDHQCSKCQGEDNVIPDVQLE
ncbi:uncharacterized protein LOC125845244 [Solanum stenotomum]|uniref:uncharacterized protein LOC125845244 n=1 Tax=Solanum stenotomum TaxID=172797 RepID=UPI0020D0B1AC|nr:uncharacterized protein LOC125845244 [Solanum stenotomum]